MTKDSIKSFFVDSPESNLQIEVTVIKVAFKLTERLEFRYPAFAGMILNLTGDITLEQGADHSVIEKDHYQLLFTVGGWATVMFSPGEHTILFFNYPLKFLELFQSAYPTEIADYRRAFQGSKTRGVFVEPQPVAATMKNFAKMLVDLERPTEHRQGYLIYQLAVSIFLQHLQRIPQKHTIEARKHPVNEVAYHAQQLLMTDYRRSWTVELLSHEIGTHKKTLTRKFKLTFNTTPMQYLQEVRLKIAYNMLMTSGSNVETIAHRVGYKHGTDFTRAFQRRFGYTPKHVQQRDYPKH